MIWEVSTVAGPCGSCRQQIDVGDPILRVSSGRLVRCQACAKRVFGAEPPTQIEAPTVPTRRPALQPFAPVRRLARDYKLAQAGE